MQELKLINMFFPKLEIKLDHDRYVIEAKDLENALKSKTMMTEQKEASLCFSITLEREIFEEPVCIYEIIENLKATNDPTLKALATRIEKLGVKY